MHIKNAYKMVEYNQASEHAYMQFHHFQLQGREKKTEDQLTSKTEHAYKINFI